MKKRNIVFAALAVAAIMLMPVLLSGGPMQPRGYLTVGEYVVTTPWQLQAGDVITLSDENGSVVFKKVLSHRTSFTPLDVPQGSYRLTITRKGRVIDEVTVPIKS